MPEILFTQITAILYCFIKPVQISSCLFKSVVFKVRSFISHQVLIIQTQAAALQTKHIKVCQSLKLKAPETK